MKIRQGFVSNSSSSSFIIINKTNENKTILDFAKQTLYLVSEFNKEYDWYDYKEDDFLASAGNDYRRLPPGKTIIDFGDEDGTTHGAIYDYALRYGGETLDFEWGFYESLR